MVAQEGETALDNGLLVILVGNLVDELRLAFVHIGTLAHRGGIARRISATEFRRERIEHAVEILIDADAAFAFFHAHEFKIDRSLLYAAAVDGHLEHLFVHDFFEEGFVKFLIRRGIDPYDERTVVLGFHAEDTLAGLAELEAEVVEIQFIVHLFGADGEDLQFGKFGGIGRPDAEVRRHKDLFLNLFGSGFGGIVTDDNRVATHEGLDAVYAADAFHPGLERHGTAVAFDGFEVLDFDGLQFHAFRNIPFFIDGRKFKAVAEKEAECHQDHRNEGRQPAQPLLAARLLGTADGQRAGVASAHAFAAKGAIDRSNAAAAGGKVDGVRASLVAEAAVGAEAVLFYHMQHLQAGIPFENLQRPAQQAHGTQEPPPGQLYAGNAQQPPDEADSDER